MSYSRSFDPLRTGCAILNLDCLAPSGPAMTMKTELRHSLNDEVFVITRQLNEGVSRIVAQSDYGEKGDSHKKRDSHLFLVFPALKL
jgi:hypothetical protein